jgi:carbon storage regulator
MLVLTRKINQQISIGEVVVTVLSMERGRIRLGIEAPADVGIRRTELAPLAEPLRSSTRGSLAGCVASPAS